MRLSLLALVVGTVLVVLAPYIAMKGSPWWGAASLAAGTALSFMSLGWALGIRR